MTPLEEKLIQLDKWYKEHDVELYRQLKSGLNPEGIRQIENTLSLAIPEDVKLLYQWHDGTLDEYLDIGFGVPFNSLEISLIERDANIDAVGKEEWSPLWFPIFGEGDEQWFIVLAKNETQTSGIYQYNFQDEQIYLQYENIIGLVSTVLEGYASGILIPLNDRPDDYYSIYDSDRFEAIRRKYNPGAYPFTKTRGQTVISTFENEDWPDGWKT